MLIHRRFPILFDVLITISIRLCPAAELQPSSAFSATRRKQVLVDVPVRRVEAHHHTHFSVNQRLQLDSKPDYLPSIGIKPRSEGDTLVSVQREE